MRMTALDVQNHAFPRRLKGYDVAEVEQFRSALVEDWAALTREAESLRKRVAELETRVETLTTHENTLRDALVTAQGMSDDLRRTAEHEAQMRVGQAELQAEKILSAAHSQAARLAQDVRELRTLRSHMASSVRATIETHLALLEGFSQDPEEELGQDIEGRIAKLASHGPPRAGAPEPSAKPSSDPAGKPVATVSNPAPSAPASASSQPSPKAWKVFLGQG